MGINLVPYPTGIDYPIGSIQRFLYERLYVQWGASGMTSDMLQVYGRVYRNSVKDGYAPQWYTTAIEYNEDLFYDDRIQALICFGLKDPVAVDGERTTYNVELYCFCNLPLVRPVASAQRMDEAVIRDILQLLQPEPFGFVTKAVYRDVDNVLSRFSGSKKKTAIVDNNHQPRLCFRIDGQIAIGMDEYGDCMPAVLPQNFSAMTGAIRVNIKTTPNELETQTLVNGVQIPLEYPTGSTITIPHIEGRYVFPELTLNKNVLYEGVDYTLSGTVFDLSPIELYDGDKIIFNCNENN